MLIVGAFGTLCTVAWLIVLWSSDKKGPAGKARDFARAAAFCMAAGLIMTWMKWSRHRTGPDDPYNWDWWVLGALWMVSAIGLTLLSLVNLHRARQIESTLQSQGRQETAGSSKLIVE